MVQRYREMADDPLRLRAFRDAIAKAVKRGARVADLGCGLGTYGVFACRAGAARVWAVDEGPIAEVAREIAAANGVGDRMRVLRGRSTEIEVPERVDLVVYEDYVAGLLSSAQLLVLRDVRARWLAPRGRLLPARARISSAPFESRELRASLDRFGEGGERVLGVDLGPARRRAFGAPHHLQLRPAALLCEPVTAAPFALLDAALDRLGARGARRIARDGVVYGLATWFALELPPRWLGTGPLDPPSAWRQLCLPFDPPLPVREGETLRWALDAGALGDQVVWRWRASTARARAEGHSLDAVPLPRAATAPKKIRR